ncbi:MAG: hypothetical protein JWL63_3093 [Rhodocyclales bacterium]|nr:hypothetical protein [Rhodocyclales bacterium]
MILASIQASALAIPFKVAFKHASAERVTTQSIWVEIRTTAGALGHGEGCPREYVTAEDLTSAQSFIARHNDEWLRTICDLGTLISWASLHRDDIDVHPAAWTAVELALLDLLAKEQGCSVEALLDVPELTENFRYTAVLGDSPTRQFEALLAHYLQDGFSEFKIKLSGERERDLAKVSALNAAGIAPLSVRADANNLWSDAKTAIQHLESLDYPFWALEEPLHAGSLDGMQQIAKSLAAKIILDESLLRIAQLDPLANTPGHWVINLRISKMGGLLRSLEFAKEARERGLGMIVGAHVGETSLLTRAALTIAQSARDILIAQEGAFGTHLLAYDLAEPALMFGDGGILNAANIAAKPGFGLTLSYAPNRQESPP